ncbi:hypothetical protein MSAN_02247600 [Mycena sanguinolenta]|uniref:FAD/NAD(P)-binding domain-containing protein n=1 Tax=Mycena sanguinolenta TaxID=230812 RepID=A0A8H6XAK8_9AGAR|nr:hypothetical protein MSAN_02247600 [Mycena sanguinolenta]
MAQAISNISELPGNFVSLELTTIFEETEALDVAKAIAPAISELLSHPSKHSIDTLFHPDAFWRDHVALSWSLRTFHPSSYVSVALESAQKMMRAQFSVISDKVLPLLGRAEIIPSSIVLQETQVHAITFPNGVSVVRAPFTFSTANPRAECTAAFKLIRMKNGDVKVFTVTTAIQELALAPWRKVPSDESPLEIPSTVPTSLDVLVVGGGHAGLSISAYLKSLDINFAMVEKYPAIGDSWAKRYDSTTLHTTRLFGGLPFVPFPSDYPEFVPAKLIAAYYAKYVQDLQLPAYPGRDCVSGVWDDTQSQWTVTLEAAEGIEVITAQILVFAVGIGGRRPIIPHFAGKDSFLGELLHSSAYKDATSWAGKRVVIIGSSTTACDVALDCSGVGADATIIQRGPTRIYPQEHIKTVQALFWNTEMPIEVGDIISTEDPMVLQATLSELVMSQLKATYERVPEYYEGLRKAGFLATVDGSVHQQIFCRSGAHYPDVCPPFSSFGAELMRKPAEPFFFQIKVKSGAEIEAITPTGIAFSDGTQVDADVIVYATGFEKDARTAVETIIGAEQAALLEPVWGVDAEGEMRGVWRPSGHDRIWFHGGELQTMRYYGKFLAVQIAAEIAKVRPTPCRA